MTSPGAHNKVELTPGEQFALCRAVEQRVPDTLGQITDLLREDWETICACRRALIELSWGEPTGPAPVTVSPWIVRAALSCRDDYADTINSEREVLVKQRAGDEDYCAEGQTPGQAAASTVQYLGEMLMLTETLDQVLEKLRAAVP